MSYHPPPTEVTEDQSDESDRDWDKHVQNGVPSFLWSPRHATDDDSSSESTYLSYYTSTTQNAFQHCYTRL